MDKGLFVVEALVLLFGAVLGWFGGGLVSDFALRSPAAVIFPRDRLGRPLKPSLPLSLICGLLGGAFGHILPEHAVWLTFSVSLLLFGTTCDGFTTYIPDETTVPLMVGGVAYALLLGLPAGDIWPFEEGTRNWLHNLCAAGTGLALGMAIPWSVGVIGTAILKKPAMGAGDSLLLGAFGTLLGPKQMVVAFLLACILGTVHNIPRLLRQRLSEIAFGPYLFAGGITMLLFGDTICYIIFIAYPRWLAGV